MYPTMQTIDVSEALNNRLTSLYSGNTGVTISTNEAIDTAVEKQKEASLYSIASNFAGILEAQAGVEAVKNSKTQYSNMKSLINTNIATTQTVMMQNFEDNMAQLDAVAAAKNVDINSQAIRAKKERGLMEMGQDFAAMTTQGELQKSALDFQYKINLENAKQARNKALAVNFDNIINAAEYLL